MTPIKLIDQEMQVRGYKICLMCHRTHVISQKYLGTTHVFEWGTRICVLKTVNDRDQGSSEVLL